MRPRLLTIVAVLGLLMAVSVSAGAEEPWSIRAPAEGATLTAPVGFETISSPGGAGGFRYFLEVAPGAGATEGFRSVTTRRGAVDSEGRLIGPLFYWDADGVSGGPYTLRVTARDAKTDEVLVQGIRNIILDAPALSPVLLLAVPNPVSGAVQLTGSVQDPDLAGWQADLIDASGAVSVLGSGDSSGVIAVPWNAAALPDGSYTLRLSAWDQAGNRTETAKTVAASSPPPQLTVSDTSVEAGPAELPLRYSAGSPVRVTVALRPLAGGDEIVRAGANGEAGADAALTVPIHLAGMTPGFYTAAVQAQDGAGRVGTAAFKVRILTPAAPPAVAELPPATRAAVMLSWSAPAAVERSGFSILRTSVGGTTVVAELGPGATAYTDRPAMPGQYGYRVVLITPDGRWIEGAIRSILVDRAAPVVSGVSVSPVDGVGLHMRWAPADDPAGIAGYQVLLVEADGRRILADLPPSARTLALPLEPGEYGAILVAIDRAGNAGESGQVAFRVERDAVALLSGGRFAPADVPGFIEEGRTWVPLRFFAEALGYQVLYDAERQVATIVDVRSGRLVMAAVGRSHLEIEGGAAESTELPAPPRLVGGRMLVPLRALAEALGAHVTWHPETRTVEILAE